MSHITWKPKVCFSQNYFSSYIYLLRTFQIFVVKLEDEMLQNLATGLEVASLCNIQISRNCRNFSKRLLGVNQINQPVD